MRFVADCGDSAGEIGTGIICAMTWNAPDMTNPDMTNLGMTNPSTNKLTLHAAATPNAPGTLVPLHCEYLSPSGIAEYRAKAFVPDPLGDYPEFSPRTIGAATRAATALARLDEQARRQLHGIKPFVRNAMRREAHSTSAMEGIHANLHTVLTQQYKPGDDKSGWDPSLAAVFNVIDAADYGFGEVQRDRPISISLVRELQQLLVRGTDADQGDAGQLRSSQVFIGSPTQRIEDARFIPMPPGLGLESALLALLDWWRDRTDPGLSIIDMALFHYQFETLHPFTDGNGRVGRLLILLQMMSRRQLTQPVLPLSTWFESHSTEYRDALLAVSNTGDWDGWVTFFSRAIEESSTEALAYIDHHA